jgi:hypothetical protein
MHGLAQTKTKKAERLETARRLAEQIATTLGPKFKRRLMLTEDQLALCWTLDMAIDGARECLARYHVLLTSFEERRRLRERKETVEEHVAAVASLLVKCYHVLHQAGHQRRPLHPKARSHLVLLRGGRS